MDLQLQVLTAQKEVLAAELGQCSQLLRHEESRCVELGLAASHATTNTLATQILLAAKCSGLEQELASVPQSGGGDVPGADETQGAGNAPVTGFTQQLEAQCSAQQAQLIEMDVRTPHMADTPTPFQNGATIWI